MQVPCNTTLYQIYTITSPLTGNVIYVGSTKDITKRQKGHAWMIDHMVGLRNMNRAERMKVVFPIDVIEVVDAKDRFKAENYWICQFHAWGFPLINRNIPGIPRRDRQKIFSNTVNTAELEYMARLRELGLINQIPSK